MLRKSAAWMAFLVLLVLVSCPRGGLATGEWITLSGEDPAAGLRVPVNDYTGQVRITFLGDCTLGGEEKSRNSRLGFVRRVEENGMDFPFRNLREMTLRDDLTVANLEAC